MSESWQLYVSGTFGQSFIVLRNYDLAGNVLSQTYPSGRTVNYQYDAVGRASGFTGNLGDGVNRTYFTGILYSSMGAMDERAIRHRYAGLQQIFLQLARSVIRDQGQHQLNWPNRYTWHQQYDYDSLNRLKRVHEYDGNPALDWQQEYLYDRYGNRTIDTNPAARKGGVSSLVSEI